MSPPFRIGVMQLTMEPLEEVLEHARAIDEGGFDTIWLAEAYPWWRKHSMEARSSTALSPLVARETERLAVGWGIISPFTRHPIQIAMEARVTQEAAGPGRFYLGLGVSKIFMRHAAIEVEAGGGDEGGGGDRPRCPRRRGGRHRRQGLLRACARAEGRRGHAALGRADPRPFPRRISRCGTSTSARPTVGACRREAAPSPKANASTRRSASRAMVPTRRVDRSTVPWWAVSVLSRRRSGC